MTIKEYSIKKKVKKKIITVKRNRKIRKRKRRGKKVFYEHKTRKRIRNVISWREAKGEDRRERHCGFPGPNKVLQSGRSE